MAAGSPRIYEAKEELIMGACPFNRFKPCRSDCELYREETRKPDGPGETAIIKGCSLALAMDHMENMNQRLAMLQAEMGETKSASVFHAIAQLTESSAAKRELGKMVKRRFNAEGLLE